MLGYHILFTHNPPIIEMVMRLPKRKIVLTVQEAQNLPSQTQVSARQLACVLGIFFSSIPSFLSLLLHYRGLHNLKHQALKKGNCNTTVPLSLGALQNFHWWIHRHSETCIHNFMSVFGERATWLVYVTYDPLWIKDSVVGVSRENVCTKSCSAGIGTV